MNIGGAIKLLRKKKEITQKDFCDKVGISQASLSQIESGKKRPKVKTLENICSNLNVTQGALMVLSLTEEDFPKDKKEFYNPTMAYLLEVFS